MGSLLHFFIFEEPLFFSKSPIPMKVCLPPLFDRICWLSWREVLEHRGRWIQMICADFYIFNMNHHGTKKNTSNQKKSTGTPHLPKFFAVLVCLRQSSVICSFATEMRLEHSTETATLSNVIWLGSHVLNFPCRDHFFLRDARGS